MFAVRPPPWHPRACEGIQEGVLLPLPSPWLQRDRWERWRLEPVAVVPDDGPEPGRLGVPLLGVVGDLLTRPADEVPPHHQLLLERLAAEQEQPGGLARGQPQRRPSGAEVEHRAALER